jgi:hypothetical protein
MATCPCDMQTAEAIKEQNKSITKQFSNWISKAADSILDKWMMPQTTAQGYIEGNVVENALTVAMALLQITVAKKIADLKIELAEDYYAMAEYKWQRFITSYVPLEKKLLREVSSVAIATMDCADDRARAESSVNSAYALLQQQLARIRKSLHICIDENMLSVIEHRRVVMLVDTENFNLSDDNYWCDILNDDRWNKRSTVLDLGRGISTLSQSYGVLAKQGIDSAGGQVMAFTNSVINSMGYLGARRETAYPQVSLMSGTSTGGALKSSLYDDDINPPALQSRDEMVISMAIQEARRQVEASGGDSEANLAVELGKMQIN